ncbi:hypothetical protein CHUAL_013392 [Chamberlinius hualienensis]
MERIYFYVLCILNLISLGFSTAFLNEIEVVDEIQAFGRFHRCLDNASFPLAVENETRCEISIVSPMLNCQVGFIGKCLLAHSSSSCDKLRGLASCLSPDFVNCSERTFASILRRIAFGIRESAGCPKDFYGTLQATQMAGLESAKVRNSLYLSTPSYHVYHTTKMSPSYRVGGEDAGNVHIDDSTTAMPKNVDVVTSGVTEKGSDVENDTMGHELKKPMARSLTSVDLVLGGRISETANRTERFAALINLLVYLNGTQNESTVQEEQSRMALGRDSDDDHDDDHKDGHMHDVSETANRTERFAALINLLMYLNGTQNESTVQEEQSRMALGRDSDDDHDDDHNATKSGRVGNLVNDMAEMVTGRQGNWGFFPAIFGSNSKKDVENITESDGQQNGTGHVMANEQLMGPGIEALGSDLPLASFNYSRNGAEIDLEGNDTIEGNQTIKSRCFGANKTLSSRDLELEDNETLVARDMSGNGTVHHRSLDRDDEILEMEVSTKNGYKGNDSHGRDLEDIGATNATGRNLLFYNESLTLDAGHQFSFQIPNRSEHVNTFNTESFEDVTRGRIMNVDKSEDLSSTFPTVNGRQSDSGTTFETENVTTQSSSATKQNALTYVMLLTCIFALV